MPTTPAEQRQARLAKMQADQRKAERRHSFLVIGIAGLLALVLIGIVVVVIVQSETERTRVEEQAEADIDGVESFEDLTQTHVETDVTYAQDPPVGGDHAPAPRWQNCGFYEAPVQEEAAVHSLEHGAVWLTHSPDLPAEQVAQLEELAAENPYLLVSPRENLPSDVVLSAWGVQLQLTSVADERVPVFLTKYLQGEQTPEPGATCAGGVATTI